MTDHQRLTGKRPVSATTLVEADQITIRGDGSHEDPLHAILPRSHPGTLIIEDDGVPISGAPHTVIDFTGPGVRARDAGSGVVAVDVPGAGGAVPVVLLWGLGIFTDTPAFVQPGGASVSTDSIDRFGFPVPFACTLRNLFARHNLAGGSGPAVTYTLFVDGIATALSVSIPTGAVGQASNLVDTVAVAEGGVVSLRLDSDSIGPNIVDAKISVRCD